MLSKVGGYRCKCAYVHGTELFNSVRAVNVETLS